MGILIRGEENKKKWDEHQRIGSARNHVVAPGRHYALIDKGYRQGQSRRRVVKIANRETPIYDGLGFTQDREVAAAAAAHGFMVIEREQPVPTGRSTFVVPELPWKKQKKENEGGWNSGGSAATDAAAGAIDAGGAA